MTRRVAVTPAGGAGDAEDDGRGHGRTEEGAGLQGVVTGGGTGPGEDRGGGPDGCPGVDTEDVGVGEDVADGGLQDHPGDGETGADRRRRGRRGGVLIVQITASWRERSVPSGISSAVPKRWWERMRAESSGGDGDRADADAEHQSYQKCDGEDRRPECCPAPRRAMPEGVAVHGAGCRYCGAGSDGHRGSRYCPGHLIRTFK
jgi:hypothetical protein